MLLSILLYFALSTNPLHMHEILTFEDENNIECGRFAKNYMGLLQDSCERTDLIVETTGVPNPRKVMVVEAWQLNL